MYYKPYTKQPPSPPIATGEWSQLKHDFSPVARDKHCAVANGNNMYVFGGFGPAVSGYM